MNKSEIEHRNRVIRAYFNGRDWDRNNEYVLKRQLISSSQQLLPNYPYVIEDEWEVKSNRSDKGCGDLVFTDGVGCFAVVEVKWIDLEGLGRSGSTKRESNRVKRRTVKKQAIEYAERYADRVFREPNPVKRIEAFIFTNEYAQPRLLQTMSFEEAPDLQLLDY